MFETIKLTPLFVVAGVGVLSAIYERATGKEKSEPIILVATLLGWGVVLFLLSNLTQEVMTVFMGR